MSTDEARQRSRREFGDVEAMRSGLVAIDGRSRPSTRQRGAVAVGSARTPVTWFASLRRSPGFRGEVSLTLALGIGVNIAIFSVLDRLFLSPPPGIPHRRQSGGVRRILPARPSVAAATPSETDDAPVLDDTESRRSGDARRPYIVAGILARRGLDWRRRRRRNVDLRHRRLFRCARRDSPGGAVILAGRNSASTVLPGMS